MHPARWEKEDFKTYSRSRNHQVGLDFRRRRLELTVKEYKAARTDHVNMPTFPRHHLVSRSTFGSSLIFAENCTEQSFRRGSCEESREVCSEEVDQRWPDAKI